MVDTRDLKSLGQKCPCGFDSRLRHKRTALAVLLCLLFTPSPCGTAPVGHWGAFSPDPLRRYAPNAVYNLLYRSAR